MVSVYEFGSEINSIVDVFVDNRYRMLKHLTEMLGALLDRAELVRIGPQTSVMDQF